MPFMLYKILSRNCHIIFFAWTFFIWDNFLTCSLSGGMWEDTAAWACKLMWCGGIQGFGQPSTPCSFGSTAFSVQEDTRAQQCIMSSDVVMAAQTFLKDYVYIIITCRQFSVYINPVYIDPIKELGGLCCCVQYQLEEKIQYLKYLSQKACKLHDLFGREVVYLFLSGSLLPTCKMFMHLLSDG